MIINKQFYTYLVSQVYTLLSNESIKWIGISINSNQSIILELCNSWTLLNGMIYSFLNWIPSSVSSIMSMSNATIIHHHPISLYLYTWNSNPLLWIQIEKGDLINQSSSFILFIFNSFDSVVAESQSRASNPRVIDPSRVRSHSSFIQSFILSNTILWHNWNTKPSNWMNMREGRFFNSSDSYS